MPQFRGSGTTTFGATRGCNQLWSFPSSLQGFLTFVYSDHVLSDHIGIYIILKSRSSKHWSISWLFSEISGSYFLFFIKYFAAPRPTPSHWHNGSLTCLMLMTVLLLIQLKGHLEACNKDGCQSLAECINGIRSENHPDLTVICFSATQLSLKLLIKNFMVVLCTECLKLKVLHVIFSFCKMKVITKGKLKVILYVRSNHFVKHMNMCKDYSSLQIWLTPITRKGGSGTSKMFFYDSLVYNELTWCTFCWEQDKFKKLLPWIF